MNWRGTPQNSPESHQGWNENAEQFKANTVYFAFDSSAVRSADQAQVAAVARPGAPSADDGRAQKLQYSVQKFV